MSGNDKENKDPKMTNCSLGKLRNRKIIHFELL